MSAASLARLRRVAGSRFFTVPFAIAAAVLAWNVYVTLHAHGIVAGWVVDEAGRPAAGVTVILFERDFINQVERARTRTGPDGAFRFTENRSHLVQVEAREGDAHSPRRTVRLWFRSEDRTLEQPLHLPAAG